MPVLLWRIVLKEVFAQAGLILFFERRLLLFLALRFLQLSDVGLFGRLLACTTEAGEAGALGRLCGLAALT